MDLAVALLDFGGPRSDEELRPFLSALLTDVLPGPAWARRLLGPLLAARRAPRVRPQYEAIGWSPLVPTHLAQAEALRARLDLPVVSGMMFTPPSMDQAADELARLAPDAVIALPMFPHYSLATTHAAFEFFHAALTRRGLSALPVHWIGAWFDHPPYLQALAECARDGIASTEGAGELHLVFSAHGLPVSYVRRGDPYPDQVRATVRGVLAALDWSGPSHLGWQSRVGPARWLAPSVPEVLHRLAGAGVSRVCLVPVSFVSEHVETLYEIDVEFRGEARRLGISHVGRAPAPGTRASFVDALADLVDRARRQLDRQACVRCLRERTVAEPLRPHCPNCAFRPPRALLDQPHPVRR